MAQDFATSYAAIVKQEKQDDGTLLVYGKATDDGLDIDNQICDAAWLNKAMPEWFKSGGNIREQHSNIAAGVAKELDSKADGHYISALVVDAQSVKKVETGVLKGFSIGIRAPRIVRDQKAANGRIIDGTIVEVSLVDRPANPNAKLMLAKSNGIEVVQVEEMIEETIEATLEEVTLPEVVQDVVPEVVVDTVETTEETPVEETVEEKAAKPTKESVLKELAMAREKCKNLEMMCKENGWSMDKAVGESAEEETEEGSEPNAAEEEVEEAQGKKPIPNKSVDSIVPDAHIERVGSVTDADIYEDSEDDSDKSAMSDVVINSIIEKAVKSATESVRDEIALLKSANEAAQVEVNKLQTELETANLKAVSGGPKRAVISNPLRGVDEFTRRAIEYRMKSANTSDPVLARGYKDLAIEQEAKAKEAQLTD